MITFPMTLRKADLKVKIHFQEEWLQPDNHDDLSWKSTDFWHPYSLVSAYK